MSLKAKEIIINEKKCSGCLMCQLKCSYLFHKEFNPSKANIIIDASNIFPKISFLEDCKECWECVKICLYGALEFKEEDI